jgi:hypothetical protein
MRQLMIEFKEDNQRGIMMKNPIILSLIILLSTAMTDAAQAKNTRRHPAKSRAHAKHVCLPPDGYCNGVCQSVDVVCRSVRRPITGITPPLPSISR